MVPKPNLLLLLPFTFFALSISASAIARPQTNPSINFIKSWCRTTQYPNLCFSTLISYANKIRKSEHRLAQAALTVSLVRAKSTTAYVSKLSKARGINRREYLAVRDCIENLGDGVDRLVQSVKEMNRMGGGVGRDVFLWHLSNVQTWVSAALTDENTCLDGFGGRGMDGGAVKVAIRRRVVHVARVTSNALALVNRFAARHRS